MEDPGSQIHSLSQGQSQWHPTRITRKTLGTLAPDLLTNIFYFLRPIDIINLRQTCKALHSASMQRTVWLDALQHVITEHHIFTPTFPLQEMSQRQLEYSALSPHVFVQKVGSKDSHAMAPYLLRTLTSICLTKKDRQTLSALLDVPQNELPQLNCPFFKIMVAPGGRFLFTISVILEHFVITLWDLGYPGSGSIHPSSVAMMVQSSGYIIWCISPTRDGLGLYLTMSIYSCDAFPKTRMIVHEIYPLDPSPSFKETSMLEVSGGVTSLTVSGQRLAAANRTDTETCFVVWDIANDLIAYRSMRYDKDIFGLHIYGDTLIACHGDSFSLWNIPSLSQRVPGCTDKPFFSASSVLDFALQDAGVVLTQLPFANVDLQYLIHLQAGGCAEVYKVDPSKPLPPYMPSKILPFVLTRGDLDVDLDIDDITAQHEICDSNVVVVLNSTVHSNIRLGVVPIPHEVDNQALSSAFCRDLVISGSGSGCITRRSFKICPATGRFCILTTDGEIRIIDCLPHCS